LSNDFDAVRDFECAGALISMDNVISNEHCVYHSELQGLNILIGSNNLKEGRIYNPAWWISYDQWTVENGRNVSPNEDNDIVIIKVNHFSKQFFIYLMMRARARVYGQG
jgi:V8-like Glu-specific endopeptidase